MVEKTKTSERKMVKELGKLAGRNFGRCPPPIYRGRSERFSSDCLTKTQVYAKAKAYVYGLKPAQCRKVNCGSGSNLLDLASNRSPGERQQ